MKPTCYIVCGPESSGNRYTTRLLVAAGCVGHGDTYQPLVDCGKGWDVVMPSVEKPMAFCRSFPHGDEADNWPDLSAILRKVAERFDPWVLVCIRNQYAVQRSQLRVGHASTAADADAAIRTSYQLILSTVTQSGCRWDFVCYESLACEQYRNWLVTRLGLSTQGPFEEFTNGNAKYV